jgi:predicted acylesterase/phospholipase RssA
MSKALVISGGGAYGSFAGGVCEHLIKDSKKDYDIYLGTSTGSLITPLLSIGDVDGLKKAYLTIKHSDIFNVSPFKVLGIHRGKFRPWTLMWRALNGQKSLGDSSVLIDTIKRYITEEKYLQIQGQPKVVGCCVSNLTTGQKEYKLASHCSYEEYVSWLAASCGIPPVMSVIEHNNCVYADGGLLEKTPIQQAIDAGATDIDAILLTPDSRHVNERQIHNVSDVIQRSLALMMNEIGRNDFAIAKLYSPHPVTLRIYTIELLIGSPLVFNSISMRHNWRIGYEYAKQDKYKTVHIG